jgi:hypothetical protein
MHHSILTSVLLCGLLSWTSSDAALIVPSTDHYEITLQGASASRTIVGDDYLHQSSFFVGTGAPPPEDAEIGFLRQPTPWYFQLIAVARTAPGSSVISRARLEWTLEFTVIGTDAFWIPLISGKRDSSINLLDLTTGRSYSDFEYLTYLEDRHQYRMTAIAAATGIGDLPVEERTYLTFVKGELPVSRRVPEPGTLSLVGAALAALLLGARRLDRLGVGLR